MPRKKKDSNHLKHEAAEKKHMQKDANGVSRKADRKLSVEIKPDNYFVLCDGRSVKDIAELAKILETLSDDVFYYHVTTEKNDFANWLNDVFKEEQLASDIRSSKSKIEMIALLYKRLFEKMERL
jgi:hypothetical protein